MELADQERWAAEQEVQVSRVRQLLQECLSRAIRVTLVVAKLKVLCWCAESQWFGLRGQQRQL